MKDTSKKDDNHLAASVKVGPKGQIVIPKEMRDMFGIEPGETLILLADRKRGIAVNKNEKFSKLFSAIMSGKFITIEEEEEE